MQVQGHDAERLAGDDLRRENMTDNGIVIVEPHLTDVIPALSLGPFYASPSGLIVDGAVEDIPFELWEMYGQGLQVVFKSLPFVIGDWLAFGERTYGDKYVQAVALTGYATQTMYNAKFVCDHVPQNIRRPDTLSFAHHAEVASLPVEKQAELLEEAEELGWTRAEMRANVHGEQDPIEQADEIERAFAKLLTMVQEMTTYAMRAADLECLQMIEAILEDRRGDD